jgi:magnesium transporter
MRAILKPQSMNKRKRSSQAQRKNFVSPGTVKYVGRDVNDTINVKVFEFNELFLKEKTFNQVEELSFQSEQQVVKWLSVDGIHQEEFVEKLGVRLNLHPLILEDIVNTLSKTKMEAIDDNRIFIVAKTIDFNMESNELAVEHTALLMQSKTVLMSLQERNSCDAFAPIRSRLEASIGKTRRNKADYLLFSLLDVIVDQYFETIEKIADNLEEIEDQIIADPKPHHQTKLFNLKRILTSFRKFVFPLREVLGSILHADNEWIDDATKIYFKDLNDHVVQVLDSIEIQRDINDSLINLYMTQLSNKMNSVMKTLTVFTAIFMPLTFIAGIYGMNFEVMPEIREPNGYYYTLGSMFVIAILLWLYFKWKKYV